MTPEERVKRLKDFDRWTVTSVEPRAGAVRARRLPTFVVPLIAGVATVALAAVVIVGAVNLREYRALHPAATDTPTSSASPSPSPTADPVVPLDETDAKAPTQQFGGDCSAIISDAQMSTLVGSDMLLQERSSAILSRRGLTDYNFALRQVGGLGCEWGTEEGMYSSGGLRVDLLVLPESAVPAIDADDCGEGLGEGNAGAIYCRIEHVAHGYRISGGAQGATHAESVTIADRLIAAFDSAAASTPVVEPPRGGGEWSSIQDCDALGQSIDVDGILGAGSTFGSTGLGAGRNGNLVMEALLWDMGLWTACGVQAGDDLNSGGLYKFGTIGIYAGGSWVNNKLVKVGADAIDVPGFDRAAVRTGDGTTTLYVFRGPNLLTYEGILGDDVAAAFPILNALADALDEQ
jgi:hypothetical protein